MGTEAQRARADLWSERQEASAAARRRAGRIGVIGFLLAVALPVLLFHGIVGDIASEFRLDFNYLVSEWTPWILIAAGLAFCLPVAWSAGRDPESRWYPRSRNAYAAWGITLYLLGLALAAQVAQIARGPAG